MPPKRTAMARRRARPVEVAPELVDAVPAWVAKRGPDAAERFLARRDERRRDRVAELVDRAPQAVKREGKAAVKAWAEALADEPRLVPIDDSDPRAPLPPRR